MTSCRRIAGIGIALTAACSGSDRNAKAPAPANATRANSGLAILAPAAGDTLIEGHRYIIRWRAPGSMHINLGAALGGHDMGMMLSGAPGAQDSLVWVVPEGFVTGFGLHGADNVRLRLENADSAAQWVDAGPFTVIGP